MSTVPPGAKAPAVTGLALLALGVVFGDIGTSPLYAFREAFTGAHGIAPTTGNVFGVLSLILWSLILVISVKYLLVILRADNRGEGGILALMALIHPEHGKKKGGPRTEPKGSRLILILMGLFGAALLYGDGMITPAISVLSAVEGLTVVTHTFEPYVIPITIGILVGLFLMQSRGTGRIGALFGPITLLWFLALAVLGIRGILLAPQVLGAVNPWYAVEFFLANKFAGFVVLGAVFLVVTGGEALYADLGHFGRKPIRMAWFAVAFPALILNYFGQGALLLTSPEAAAAPFYLLAPRWALVPLVILATAATVIASQAIISGAFSLTMQAINLGYLPRLRIEHTSAATRGQIYIPEVNIVLAVATIGLVLGFRSSGGLAGAYGLAVSLDMIIATMLAAVAAREVFGWHPVAVGLLFAPFLLIDLAFLSANVPKIPEGGWFALAVAAGIFTLMTTWRRGRRVLGERLRGHIEPLEGFLERIRIEPVTRVPGTAVFLTGNPGATPAALKRNLQHNKVLHERVLLLTVLTEELSHVHETERLEFDELGQGFYRAVVKYGFMEDPSVPDIMQRLEAQGFRHEPEDTTYFLGRERIIAVSGPGGMALWREKLFAIMARNALGATVFFRIPPERVVEMGAQIKL